MPVNDHASETLDRLNPSNVRIFRNPPAVPALTRPITYGLLPQSYANEDRALGNGRPGSKLIDRRHNFHIRQACHDAAS